MSNREEEVKKLYDEMVGKNKLTPAGVERAIILYQLIGSIINKYRPLIQNPVTVSEATSEMEKEVILAVAKELDRNFFEGMLDVVMKSTMSVLKIPQVAEMTKSFAMEFLGASKLKDSGSLEAAMDKLFSNKPGDETNKKPPVEVVGEESLESILSQFSKSARGKKEDLN